MITPALPQNTSLAQRHERLLQRLEQARCDASRSAPIRLLAVSKGHPASAIATLAARGQRAFGENYLQAALAKMNELSANYGTQLGLEWHYIGALQKNKTRAIAEHFDWVQSVDRLVLAQRLSEQRPHQLPPLQVLIQVNIDAEPQKAGVAAADTLSLAQAILSLPRIQLRGLMGLPQAGQSNIGVARSFHRLAELYRQLQELTPDVDTLSMGMSEDLEPAVAAGSTMIRIGTALFGARTVPPAE